MSAPADTEDGPLRLPPMPDVRPDVEPDEEPSGVWDQLDRMSLEQITKIKPDTPVPPATTLVMFWQVRNEISSLEGKVDGLGTVLEYVSRRLDERGRFWAHVASVCRVATKGIGAVTKAFVDDAVVRRMLAAAVLIGALGAGGFTWFSGSYGDASVDFGDQPQVDQP